MFIVMVLLTTIYRHYSLLYGLSHLYTFLVVDLSLNVDHRHMHVLIGMLELKEVLECIFLDCFGNYGIIIGIVK